MTAAHIQQVFPYAVAGLETAAALVYIGHHNWRMAILWGGYAIAAWALAGVK